MGRGRKFGGHTIGRWASVAGAGGLVAGAIVLAVHAYVNRRPDHRIGGGFERGTQYLALSLGFGIAIAVVVIGLGVTLLFGLDVGRWCSWVLAGTTSAAAWVYLSGTADSARVALSGPGSRPMIELSQFTWVLYAIAALLLTVAAVLDGSGSGRWWVTAPAVAGSLVIALLVGSGIVSAVTSQQVKPAVAEPIPIPDLPTQVGREVAYSLVSTPALPVVPAGPGFVMGVGSELVAFDGATGGPRWRLPDSLVSQGCSFGDVTSTGTGPDSMVVARCNRMLVGVDAMTGTVLWTNHSRWSTAGPLLVPGGSVAVVHGTDDAGSIGSLDPRSGEIRWSRGVGCSPFNSAATAAAIVWVDECATGLGDRVRIFDARSGAEARFVLPLSGGLATARGLQVWIAAVQENSVLLYVMASESVEDTLVLVDTATGVAREIPGQVDIPVNSDSRQYPGALIEVAGGYSPETVDVMVMPRGERRHVVGPRIFLAAHEFEPGLRWAQVGDDMVSAATFTDGKYSMTIVHTDGAVSVRPSPCGDDRGGVMVVPGALLVTCVRGDRDQESTVDILALK